MLIFIISFIFRIIFFVPSFLIPGPDGGYYAVQIRELFRSGTLKYDAPPLSFLIFSIFVFLLNNFGVPFEVSVILGVKIGVSFMESLTVFPAYFLIYDITRKNEKMTLFVTILFSFHPYFLFLMGLTSLLKNATGIFFLFCYIYFLYKSFASISFKIAFMVTLFFILTALTHILCFGVALAYTISVLPVLLYLKGIRKFLRLGFFKSLILTTLLLSIVILLLAIFEPSYLGTYWKFESFLESFLASEYRVGMFPVFFSSVIFLMLHLFLFIVCMGMALEAISKFKHTKTNTFGTHIITFGSSAVGLFLLFVNIGPDWYVRFIFMIFVPFVVVFGYLISKIKNKKVLMTFLIFSTIILLEPLPRTFMNLHPEVHPIEIVDLNHMKSYLPQNKSIVIVARFGLHYWVEWFLDVDVSDDFVSIESLLSEYDLVYIVIRKYEPIPPINKTLVFEGQRLILFLVNDT